MGEILRLPLLPLRGMTVFPYTIVHLDIGRPASVAAVEDAMLKDKKLFLVSQRDMEEDDPKEADLFSIGAIAEVRNIVKIPGGGNHLLVEGVRRATMLAYDDAGDYPVAEVEVHEDAAIPSLQQEALMRGIVRQFEEWVKLTRKIPPETLISVAVIDDASRLADLIASQLNLTMEPRQALLEALDLKTRLKKLYAILSHELEVLAVEKQIGGRLKKQMDKLQKDHYLREKIKAIHKELGEEDDVSDEITEYRKIMEEGNFPEKVVQALEKELARLKKLPESSQEADVVRSYIDTVTELPWGKESKDTETLEKAEHILNQDHYGLEKVKDRILDFLAVHKRTPEKPSPILCLVGPPGVGKTSLATSIARATGRNFVRSSLGGVRDEAEIRGHRRTYVAAMPGRIIEGIKEAGTCNPVFLLDEVDKMNMEYRGDPTAALLEVLDPAQNKTFRDHYINLPFDLSKVLWVITANDLGSIPRPLRDRMEIILLSSYTAMEKEEIAKRYLIPRQRTENGLSGKEIVFSAGVLPKIIAEYTREAGVRELERLVGRVCRKATRKLVTGEAKSVRVTKANLKDYLGKPKFLQTKAEKEAQTGVVTGMAWTEVGGDILLTEASAVKGKGKLILTGHLGDVMQESAQAALSYIRSRTEKYGLADDFYEHLDIHIHVPEGATPKDGPSAGITMTTAMVSALTKQKVRSDVAMTGEVTLRGNVLPIGGLKEKVLAAYREGMHTIILPKENERDIEEIPEIVREKMEFCPVKHMDEVLDRALLH